jgi:hypothetical protein
MSPPAGRYVLDFTQGKQGGLDFGSSRNLLFSFDLASPVRSYAVDDILHQSGPGFDVSSTIGGLRCPQDVSIIQQVKAPPPIGDVANVTEVDLEIHSSDAPTAPRSYCFLYRDQAGTWHASQEVFHSQFVADLGIQRVTIPIDKGALSQLYVASGYSGELLTKVTYHVAP